MAQALNSDHAVKTAAGELESVPAPLPAPLSYKEPKTSRKPRKLQWPPDQLVASTLVQSLPLSSTSLVAMHFLC